MSGQPWLKFFPADWRQDPALRMCSLAARGMWMEMLCLMWQAEPCGSLLVNGRQVTAKQLAPLVGTSAKEAEALVDELDEAGVFSRDHDGTIYSRRMRKDILKAARDRANGKGGGNPKLKKGVNPPDKPDPNGGDNGRDMGGDKAHDASAIATQKPEARSQKETLHRRERGDLDQIETKLRQAADLPNEPSPALFDLSPILGLMDAGFDLETDILPVLRARRRAGVRTWSYFVQAIHDARATRVAAASGTGVVRLADRQPLADKRHPVLQAREEIIEELSRGN